MLFSDPPRYISYRAGHDLERDVKAVADQFASQWPAPLSDRLEVKMLKAIREYLKDPDGCRAKANEVYVAKQLKDSREFFDRVEVRPLTAEQREAVVIDEDRNLVVAAAGSGKTSVIVAKAGWLVWKNYRQPSEVLLLAFARDARKEMEERLQKRLDDQTTQSLTVRTFHSLGMSIIGQAEGRLPTLAKVAEDSRALSDLLKSITDGLLTKDVSARILLEWFQTYFVRSAPRGAWYAAKILEMGRCFTAVRIGLTANTDNPFALGAEQGFWSKWTLPFAVRTVATM